MGWFYGFRMHGVINSKGQLMTVQFSPGNTLMPMADRMLLRQRFTIETLFGTLKRDMELEHTRHRSVDNAFLHSAPC